MAIQERMGPQDRAVALLLAQAGIRSVAALARIVAENHPGLVDQATIYRYLYDPPAKLNFDVMTAIAEACEVSAEDLRRIIATARYLGRLGFRTLDETEALAAAVG